MTQSEHPLAEHPLLVELLTEELPPRALQTLGLAFAQGIQNQLEKQQLLAPGCITTDFATPRRLAVRLSNVLAQAPTQAYTEKLMPAKIGLTDCGAATPALIKKLASKGLAHLHPSDLVTESDGKQDYLYAKGVAAGLSLQDGLQDAVDYTLANLPIPKVMRYQLADGVTSVKFVRPAHKLTVLFGACVVPIKALGLSSGRGTLGHRFMADNKPITIDSPDSYEQQLLLEGKVIASFTLRRQAISTQLQAHTQELHATLGDDPQVAALLDEVTALVEYPCVYAGEFDPKFLQVPPECLILTMRLNQKYFPLFEPETGRLTHRFLIVSNMQVNDPSAIVEGNQRVIRPRLADAQFFFETDRKTTLEARVAALATSVYHNKLGSQLDRVERLRKIAQYLAAQLDANTQDADRAALLAKADLGTNMVGEFPELQGIMGAHYAHADGESQDVILALREQYKTRIDSAIDSTSLISAILFMAERVETLVGIWGIGLIPTGERDPYGLRRSALGLISAFEQLNAGGYLTLRETGGLDLNTLLNVAGQSFPAGTLSDSTIDEVQSFVYERYRNLLNNDHEHHVVDAVLCLAPPLHQVQARVQACALFALRPEATALAAANKRIVNLLKKAEGVSARIDPSLLQEPAEQALALVIGQVKPVSQSQFAQGDFAASLATLAQTKAAVDAFFTDIMVMADDPAMRTNRLALLNDLHKTMNQVADISRLAQ